VKVGALSAKKSKIDLTFKKLMKIKINIKKIKEEFTANNNIKVKQK